MSNLLPAVYLNVEDRSFDLPVPSISRSGFIVIISDRGEHNRVVRLSDGPTSLHNKYGKPDLPRTGLAHYLADQFLRSGGTIYVVRPVIVDSDIPDENQSIANVAIKHTSTTDQRTIYDITGTPDTYLYSELADASSTLLGEVDPLITYPAGFSKYVSVTSSVYDVFDIGDSIDNDLSDVTTPSVITHKFTEVDPASSTVHYYLGIDAYPGAIVVSDTATILYKYEPRSGFIPTGAAAAGYTFTNALNYIAAIDQASYDAVDVGTFISPSLTNALGAEPVEADVANFGNIGEKYQVIDKQYTPAIAAPPTPATYHLILDRLYEGVTTDMEVTVGAPTVNAPFQRLDLANALYIDEVANVRYSETEGNVVSGFDETSNSVLWYLSAIGTGTYYNNIKVIGVRNVTFEKIYVDAVGNPLYKYAFMDVFVLEDKPGENAKILEGPFTVSMINKTNAGTIITDINTGQPLYIDTVLSEQSNVINVNTALGVENYLLPNLNLTAAEAEANRLEVLQLFSRDNVFRSSIVGNGGVKLSKGEDGKQYDEFGRLNLASNLKLNAIIQQVYSHSYASPDRSIENIHNVLYPRFRFDYVISGGYNADIQSAARELVDLRLNSMLLADTGTAANSAAAELVARQSDIAWNTFNAMIYTGYRTIKDPYSGSPILMTPVYNAIERHLEVDRLYWLAEPVAGITKGAIQIPIKLRYQPDITELEDIINSEMNPTIAEPDGVYFLTQVTALKQLSVLSNGNVVKFIHFVRNELPSRLKDILKRKFTTFWINTAGTRTNTFMTPYVETGGDSTDRLAILRSFTYRVIPNEVTSDLLIILTIRPLRTINSITINIVVK